jgi:mannose-6-phosphate isomerase-like protein (cupin superfamily)
MLHKLTEAESRDVDEALTITDLFEGAEFNFDFVVAELEGDHPTVINYESDRAYFVLEGEGEVQVGEEMHDVKSEDLVTIEAGEKHSIRGNLRYLVITSPPFDPDNEEVIEG